MTQELSQSGEPNKSDRREGFFARLRRGGLLARFAKSRRGNVAMSFALAAIPLIVATGTAIDLSRALIVRERLIHALDAAGLAVGRTIGLSQADMSTLATNFFNANYPHSELGSPGTVNVSVVGNDITLSVSADLNTAVMGIVGIDHLVVNVSNKVTRATKGLELVLALDTTGSMADDSPPKIQSLQTAANQLLDILFGDSTLPTLLKVGIVPFAAAVRVDPTIAVNNGWIDTNGTSSVAQLNFSGGKYAYWLYTNPGGLSNTTWTGCVEARPNRLDETDTPPASLTPDTRWVPMFDPDEPHVNEPENSSWNPAAPNQNGLSSAFINDYINNYIPISSVTKASATFTSSSSLSTLGIVTGDGPVRLTVKSGGSFPTDPSGVALLGTKDFWIIKASSTTFKLATSRANALASTAAYASFKSAGSGTMTMVESWGSGAGTGTANGGTSLIDQAARQKEWQKYIGKTYSGQSGPLRNCGMQPMLLPTNDKAALQAEIAALSPAGNTHVPLGLSWAWRILSGKLPGAGTVDYSNEQYVKAIVLMTDGENTMNGESNTLNASDYSAYGYASQQRLGTGVNTASKMATEIDNSLTRTCNAIHALTQSDGTARIRVYTIAFGTAVPTYAQNLLQSCATEPDFFFASPDQAALEQAFQTIATDLSNLRISH